MCRPAEQGVRCQLLALFRDVSQPPRDVTAEASWRVSGAGGAKVSAVGLIAAAEDGEVEIRGEYGWHSASARARLKRGRPGQLLGTLRGRVYIQAESELKPVGQVRVEIVSGPAAGTWTTTRDDGSYELVGLEPGDFLLRATKIGYADADGLAPIHPGDNRVSLLIAGRASRRVGAENDRDRRRGGRGISSLLLLPDPGSQRRHPRSGG
jgi:hypothetical protein